MYTAQPLEYDGSITYLMIIVDDFCSKGDFFNPYDFRKKNIFINESFMIDSFKIKDKININTMIEKKIFNGNI